MTTDKWRSGSFAGAVIACGILIAGISSAHASVDLFAEAPSSSSVGADIPVRLRARITESINALKVTVLVGPESVDVVRFDDNDSVIRLWLQRGLPVEGGVVLEGVVPGGVGPAFNDVIDIGTLWLRTASVTDIHVWFADAHVYLNQPVPTLSAVTSSELVFKVGASGDTTSVGAYVATVTDSDVRIVREPELFEGRRTLIFDIKTDRATVELVRVRERWLGVYGAWREAASPSTLSDGFGLSILDVALSDAMGNVHVVSVVPLSLKIIWSLAAALLIAIVGTYLKKRF